MKINVETEIPVSSNEFRKAPEVAGSRKATLPAESSARWGTFSRITVFAVALLATLIPISVGEVDSNFSASQMDRYLMLHGYYAMNEQELLDIVKFQKLDVYWTGPLVGARYVLDSSEIDRITIRYLLSGDSIDDIDSGKRVISTYRISDGYDVVAKASKVEGTSGLSTKAGNRILFYEKYPNNIYLVIKGKDLEIEIYDKEPGRALQLATTDGIVRKV
jgi:hypothetical protein